MTERSGLSMRELRRTMRSCYGTRRYRIRKSGAVWLLARYPGTSVVRWHRLGQLVGSRVEGWLVDTKGTLYA